VYPIIDRGPSAGAYDVAWALDRALEVAEPGDVVLIEQQAADRDGRFVPVSIEPGVARLIQTLSERGVVVVEPAGNGAADLDDTRYEGAFQNDSGSWMVGAARAGTQLRAPFSGYGSAVDLFLDGEGTVAPSSADGSADLFFPGRDPRQAYTASFGGTSGASAQVAGLAAALQGASMAIHGEVASPGTLLAWVRASGVPQDITDRQSGTIGVRPSLQRTLRSWIRP